MTNATNDSEFTTPKAVAARLLRSIATIYAMISAQQIRAVRVGKLWLIPVAEVERILAEGEGNR